MIGTTMVFLAVALVTCFVGVVVFPRFDRRPLVARDVAVAGGAPAPMSRRT